jgi:hypothetical protein
MRQLSPRFGWPVPDRADLRPPTSLTVLTQTLAFVRVIGVGLWTSGQASRRPFVFARFSKIDRALAAICLAVAKGQTIGPA